MLPALLPLVPLPLLPQRSLAPPVPNDLSSTPTGTIESLQTAQSVRRVSRSRNHTRVHGAVKQHEQCACGEKHGTMQAARMKQENGQQSFIITAVWEVAPRKCNPSHCRLARPWQQRRAQQLLPPVAAACRSWRS